MASKERFIKPEDKKYSVKGTLTHERLMDALIGIRAIQTHLWETMPDGAYEKLEKEFDTAIASMMAHACDIKPKGENMEERCVCCGEVIPEGRQVCPQCENRAKRQQWIPADMPPYSDTYVLLSFSNFDVPIVGRYERDGNSSGAYYIGDETEPCTEQDIFVNAWMTLPTKYEGE